VSTGLITQSRPSFRKMVAGETPHAFHAFEIYRDLGPSRNLAAVAEEMGLTVGSVSTWSGKHQWAARVRFHDEVMSHVTMEAKKDQARAAMAEKYEERKAARDKLVTDIRTKVDRAIQMVSPEQIARNPRLIPLLLGYADRTENDLFSEVRGGEVPDTSSHNLLSLGDMSDDQLEELARIADSLGVGQGTD
jgi:hypothetical protein